MFLFSSLASLTAYFTLVTFFKAIWAESQRYLPPDSMLLSSVIHILKLSRSLSAVYLIRNVVLSKLANVICSGTSCTMISATGKDLRYHISVLLLTSMNRSYRVHKTVGLLDIESMCVLFSDCRLKADDGLK